MGSPPRVRELLVEKIPQIIAARITPACAGITSCAGCMQKCVQDHPRVCGNYMDALAAAENITGSPPRVRELLCACWAWRCRWGITPACAGITARPGDLSPSALDHPRVCGNYKPCLKEECLLPGSPPRVRELRVREPSSFLMAGITPACAGITLASGQRVNGARDHPRVCGNYRNIGVFYVYILGSPPRVRELRFGFRGILLVSRITPACAGITANAGGNLLVTWDHPRVCGNYTGYLTLIDSNYGSPPRVRELPECVSALVQQAGITPACAGITTPPEPLLTGSRDHPRVCGNYLLIASPLAVMPGSPPRVRELLPACCNTPHRSGITPACAGIT